MFEMLTGRIFVTFRCVNGMMTFHVEDAVIIGIKFHLVNHAARNHEIISVFERNISEKSSELSFSAMNENYFVRICILIEIIFHAFFRSREPEYAIGIHEHGFPGIEKIIGWRYVEAVQQ